VRWLLHNVVVLYPITDYAFDLRYTRCHPLHYTAFPHHGSLPTLICTFTCVCHVCLLLLPLRLPFVWFGRCTPFAQALLRCVVDLIRYPLFTVDFTPAHTVTVYARYPAHIWLLYLIPSGCCCCVVILRLNVVVVVVLRRLITFTVCYRLPCPTLPVTVTIYGCYRLIPRLRCVPVCITRLLRVCRLLLPRYDVVGVYVVPRLRLFVTLRFAVDLRFTRYVVTLLRLRVLFVTRLTFTYVCC